MYIIVPYWCWVKRFSPIYMELKIFFNHQWHVVTDGRVADTICGQFVGELTLTALSRLVPQPADRRSIMLPLSKGFDTNLDRNWPTYDLLLVFFQALPKE